MDALEMQVEDACDGFYEQCFGKARCAGDKTMAACEQCEEDLLHDFFLPDDYFGQLVLDVCAAGD